MRHSFLAHGSFSHHVTGPFPFAYREWTGRPGEWAWSNGPLLLRNRAKIAISGHEFPTIEAARMAYEDAITHVRRPTHHGTIVQAQTTIAAVREKADRIVVGIIACEQDIQLVDSACPDWFAPPVIEPDALWHRLLDDDPF